MERKVLSQHFYRNSLTATNTTATNTTIFLSNISKQNNKYTLTLCLVGVKIGRMENRGRKIGWKIVFSTVWQKKENVEGGKPGRKFSLTSPEFSSSQIRRKRLERKVLS